MSKLRIVPVSLREAQAFVREHHRHNSAPQGHRFSVGLADGDDLVGVAIAGRPVARHQDDGKTLEALRVCILPDTRNGNSMLYGAICRAGTAMGYERVITYTLPSESGASLRASGFEMIGMTDSKASWDTPGRPRKKLDKFPAGRKIRWQRML